MQLGLIVSWSKLATRTAEAASASTASMFANGTLLAVQSDGEVK